MRQKLRLPEDMKDFVRKSILKRVIPCAMLLVLFATFLILWGERAFNTGNNISWRIFYYGLTLALPFIITGVPFRLIDRTYLGTVESIEIKSAVVLDNDRSVRVERHHWYSKNDVYLNVLTYEGKRIEKHVYGEHAKNVSQLEKYKVGDTVFHLYGTKEVVTLPTAADTHVRCAVCGRVNDIAERHCKVCCHTLIKTPPSIM